MARTKPEHADRFEKLFGWRSVAAVFALATSACGRGDNWVQLPARAGAPASTYTWHARCCEDYLGVLTSGSGEVWAVGDNGTIFHSSDRGVIWKKQNTGVTESLHAIHRDPSGVLWALGGMGWQGGGVLLRSDTPGIWARVPLPLDTSLHSIWFVAGRIFVGGDDGYLFISSDGKNWRYTKVPHARTIRWIHSAPDGTGFSAGGDSGTYLSSADGSVWTARSLADPEDQLAFFACSEGKQRWIVGQWGLILHSGDSGNNWERQESRLDGTLYDVTGTPDCSRILAVGYEGTMLVTEDRGGSWRQLPQLTSAMLTGLSLAPDSSEWFAVGREATALRSRDGEKWSLIAGKRLTDYNAVRATSEPGVAILGGDQGILRWERRKPPVRVVLPRNGEVNGLAATHDRSTFWAVGNQGFAARSVDGGKKWASSAESVG
jgi:photosystem II stability/assembly factor-like uncharacterized protein